MDLQLIIALNIMAVAAIACLISALFKPSGYRSWFVVNFAVLVAGVVGYFVFPDIVGWVTAGMFVPFVLGPAALGNLAARAEKAGNPALAERLTRLTTWLHPSQETQFNVDLSAALREPTPAGVEAALMRLEARVTPPQRMMVRAFLATEQDDWAAALAAARDPAAPPFDLKPTEIRALGELGRVDEMVQVYEATKTRLLGPHFATAQLFVFAFTGRPDRVADLLKGSLSALPMDGKTYWMAIARRAASGDDAQARAALEAMAQTSPRAKSRRAAERQLRQTQPVVLSDATRAIVDAADARMQREVLRRTKPLATLYVTLALMAANIAALGYAEWKGGSEEMAVLFELGALWPPAVTRKGEWWRLMTANFLHFGPIHLAVNLFVLALFGRMVESRLGAWHMLGVYLWCALGSTAMVHGLMSYGWIETNVLVGASGAIFGLLGVIAAFDVATWIRSRDQLDLSRLGNMVLILAIQAVVDLSIPNVSFAAHASGLLMGLMAGGVLAFLGGRTATAPLKAT